MRTYQVPALKLVITWLLLPLLLLYAGATWISRSARALEGSPITYQSGQTSTGTLLGLAALIVIVFLIPQFPFFQKTIAANRWLVVISILAAASTLWSDDPVRTGKAVLLFGGATGLGLFLIQRFTCRQQMQLIMAGGLCSAALSVINSAFISRLGLAPWDGIFYGKNQCGMEMLFFLLPAFHYPWKRKALALSYFLLLLFVISMSRCASAAILTFCYCFFAGFVGVLNRFSPRSRRLLSSFAIPAVLFLSALVAINIETISLLSGKTMALSGRPQIWAALARSAMKQPFLGYGYQAFWSSGEALRVISETTAAFGFTGAYAHNGYLDVWLQLGLTGLLVLFYGAAHSLKRGWLCLGQRPISRSSAWYLGIIGLSICYNFVEVTFLSQYLTWSLYVLASIGLAKEASAIRVLRNTKLSPIVGSQFPQPLSYALRGRASAGT